VRRAKPIHYDLSQWTDYVRSVAPHLQMEEMRKHLAAGCSACARDERIMREVQEFAERDAALDIPEDEVNRVRRLAILQRPRNVFIGSRRATLLFDSFREPIPSGVRSAAHAPRHSLYQGGGFSIDFQQNAVPGGTAVSLIGQVTLGSGTRDQVPGVTVSLRAGRKTLAQATTNPSGEFEMEYAPPENRRLDLRLSGLRSAKARRRGEGTT